MVPATEASPTLNKMKSSVRVIFPRQGRIKSGASIMPMNTVAPEASAVAPPRPSVRRSTNAMPPTTHKRDPPPDDRQPPPVPEQRRQGRDHDHQRQHAESEAGHGGRIGDR